MRKEENVEDHVPGIHGVIIQQPRFPILQHPLGAYDLQGRASSSFVLIPC